MSFLRRKSGVYHEDIYLGDPDPQYQRRRLSKPAPTSSSSSSCAPSPLPNQQFVAPRTSSRPGQSPQRTYFPNDSREAVRSHLFTSPSSSELDLIKPTFAGLPGPRLTLNPSQSTGVQPSSSQLSLLSPTLPTYPISRMLSAQRASDNRKPSISSLGSKDRYAADLDLGNVSPESSTEQLVTDPAPPPRRTASFTPGMATRISNIPPEIIHEEPEVKLIPVRSVVKRKAVPQRIPTVEIDAETSAPVSNERSGSPSNSNVAHIGRLGLGSLHVVNGRASPVPSEKSKKGSSFWAPTIRRETSSCYPESEIGTVRSRRTVNSDWEDEPLPTLARDGSVRSGPNLHRAFSFNPGSEATFNNPSRVPSRTLPGIDASILTPPEDKTKTLADDYISGLPVSPFAESSPPLSPVSPPEEMHHEVEASEAVEASEIPSISEAPETIKAFKAPETPQPPRRTISVHSIELPMQEDPSSPVSLGSVRHHPDKAYGRRSFIDETLAESPVTDRPASPASFFSVPEPEDEVDAPFASAVEIQPTTSGPKSPRKPVARFPVPEARDSREAPRGPISDSGYSSNTSLGLIANPRDLRIPAGPEVRPEKEKRRLLRFPLQKTQKSGKPVLVKPTASAQPPSPTSVRIESISALTSQTSFAPTNNTSKPNSITSLPASPVKQKKERKKLIKLRRKSTAEVAGDLVVQRLASVDCFNIPPVSNTTKNNLAQRALAIPELDRTYRTQDHTATSTNASVLSLATAVKDVRFPSPAPEEEGDRGRGGQQRSTSRGRSFSRPRSWFDWPKRDKSGSRSNSKTRENTQPELNDLGNVADLLGSNPYDIASKPRTTMPPSAWNNRPDFMRRRTSPSNITSSGPRPKSTMDDQTASTVSRLRRRSLTDKDVRKENRKSFDERGSVPWRPSQDVHNVSDVPPLPPVPSPEEINRRFSRNATHSRPVSYQDSSPTSARNSRLYDEDGQRWYQNDQQHYQNSEGIHQDNHNLQGGSMVELHERPPPPPHSPQPIYVEEEHHAGYVEELDHVAAQEQAPLPPRHSPRPSYIEAYDQYDHAAEEEEAPAPPPPSHSPRPMDVTADARPQLRSGQGSWSSQANAWKARRQSAGEALRRTWTEVEQDYHTQHMMNDAYSYPTAARPKPASNRWTIMGNPQQNAYQDWNSSDVSGSNGGYYDTAHQQYSPEPTDYLDEDQHYLQYEQFSSDQYRNHPDMDQSLHSQNYDDYTRYPQPQRQQHRHQQSFDQWRRSHPHSRSPQHPRAYPSPQQQQQSPQHHQHQTQNFSQDYNRHNSSPRQRQQQQQQRNLPSPTRHSTARPTSQQRQTTYPPQPGSYAGSHVGSHVSHASQTSHTSRTSRSPQPMSQHQQPRSRPTSRHSHHSHHSHVSHRSLAEELHPELYSSPSQGQAQAQAAVMEIGRYTGGLDIDNGIVGAVGSGTGPGTGNGSGDRRKRHSWLDMESYGIDLGDVPGMPVMAGVGVVGGGGGNNNWGTGTRYR